MNKICFYTSREAGMGGWVGMNLDDIPVILS